MVSTVSPSNRWLFGAVPDLLLGCGVAYIAIFALFAIGGEAARAAQPSALLPALLVLLSLPHYGATIVRVYEQRVDRRRYALFAVWATLGMVALFAAGLRNVALGSAILTLYLTWSPWHYSGQNYGLAVMFLRRRGFSLEPATKRLLYASFGFSYALVFLAFHKGAGSGAVQYAQSDYVGSEIAFLPLGLPAGLSQLAFAVLLVGYVATVVTCYARLLREGSLRDLAPAAVLTFTQALWFSIPIVTRLAHVETGIEPIDRYGGIQDYVFWVALGHAAQYIWVTTYFARGTKTWSGYSRYLGKVFVAGVALWTVPALLFSSDLFGPTSYASGVTVLVAASINLHHFILDGAIWKLRDGRIARVLLRSRPAEETGEGRRPWLRRGVWAVATGWVIAQGLGTIDYRRVSDHALDPIDVGRVRASVSRLRWLGRDDAQLRYRLGLAEGERGDLDAARQEFLRSLEIESTGRSWIGLAHVEFHEGNPEAARAALDRAVRTDPEDAEVWARASEVWLALGDRDLGRASLNRAVGLDPSREDWAQQLDLLRPDEPGSETVEPKGATPP